MPCKLVLKGWKVWLLSLRVWYYLHAELQSNPISFSICSMYFNSCNAPFWLSQFHLYPFVYPFIYLVLLPWYPSSHSIYQAVSLSMVLSVPRNPSMHTSLFLSILFLRFSSLHMFTHPQSKADLLRPLLSLQVVGLDHAHSMCHQRSHSLATVKSTRVSLHATQKINPIGFVKTNVQLLVLSDNLSVCPTLPPEKALSSEGSWGRS